MKKALGKGLSSLIPDTYVKDRKAAPEAAKTEEKKPALPKAGRPREDSPFAVIPVSQIQPNREQPRKEFRPEAIEELAASIQEKGILQPVIVKKIDQNKYELICGERRFRAAKLCGLDEVPVIIKDVALEDLLEWALIENIQREDLNPIEEAEAYQRLAQEHNISQDDIARRVGKNRTTVTNTMRLLRLPTDIRDLIGDGLLSAGHARALLGLLTPEHQRQIARRIVEDNLSVRQVEALVTRSVAHKRKAKKARNLSPEIVDLENRLARHFGARVRVIPKKSMKQGRIEVQYFSLDELDQILEKVGLPQG